MNLNSFILCSFALFLTEQFVVNEVDYSTLKDFAEAKVNVEEFREDTMNMIPTAPRKLPGKTCLKSCDSHSYPPNRVNA